MAGGTGLDSMKLLGVGGPAVTSEKRGRLLDGERLESESKSGGKICFGLELNVEFCGAGDDIGGNIGAFGHADVCEGTLGR